jgi:hypothetical protein
MFSLGWPSTEDCPRLDWEELFDPVKTNNLPLPSIPIIPISWGDAFHFLKVLGGNPIPHKDWAGKPNLFFYLCYWIVPLIPFNTLGGLNLTHIGPGPSTSPKFS